MRDQSKRRSFSELQIPVEHCKVFRRKEFQWEEFHWKSVNEQPEKHFQFRSKFLSLLTVWCNLIRECHKALQKSDAQFTSCSDCEKPVHGTAFRRTQRSTEELSRAHENSTGQTFAEFVGIQPFSMDSVQPESNTLNPTLLRRRWNVCSSPAFKAVGTASRETHSERTERSPHWDIAAWTHGDHRTIRPAHQSTHTNG